MTRRRPYKGDAYLELYPRETSRWMNTCATCGRRGYRPDLPVVTMKGTTETAMAAHLRGAFRPLALNEAGLCDQCVKALGL